MPEDRFILIDDGREVEGPGVSRAEAALHEMAAALDRPLALDLAERCAYLGVSARARADALSSLLAPDVTLPDLTGRLHSLSGQRGKKVLLVAYASW